MVLADCESELVRDGSSSRYLLNSIFIYGSISKIINTNASGYALLMTSAVRDGGLREDSIKLFSWGLLPFFEKSPRAQGVNKDRLDGINICKGTS
jgi:hypothetical protein